MWPDSPFARPVSSFQTPVPLVTVDPDEEPDYQVCFRKEWLPYVIGSLQQLLLQTTWKTNDKDALNLVQARAQLLISMFLNACGDDMDVRQNEDNPCILEKLNEDGEWVPFADVSLCTPIAPPTLAAPKQWRFVGGHTQVSVDNGVTFFDYPDGESTSYGQIDPVFAEGVDKACVAGWNVRYALKSGVDDWVEGIQIGSSFTKLIGTVLFLVAELATVGAATPAVVAFVGVISGAGATALDEMFTENVYSEVACQVQEHVGDDGIFSGDEFAAMILEMQSLSGLVWTIIVSFFSIIGVVGVNNAISMGGITDCQADPCEDFYEHYFDFSTGHAHSWTSPCADVLSAITSTGWANAVTATNEKDTIFIGSPSFPAHDILEVTIYLNEPMASNRNGWYIATTDCTFTGITSDGSITEMKKVYSTPLHTAHLFLGVEKSLQAITWTTGRIVGVKIKGMKVDGGDPFYGL